MSQVSLEPYIFFKGNCREAMEFYKSVFGGEISLMEADENMPDDNAERKAWMKGKVMHASLKGGMINLMASDGFNASDQAKKISLSLGGTDEAQMREIFDKLAEGGKVSMPLKKEFWGDIFGLLTDKYGVEWMMNIGQETAAN